MFQSVRSEVRTRTGPRPTSSVLLDSPLHVVAREFPETLTVFREHGLSLAGLGDRALSEIPETGELLAELEAATRWRPEPHS